MHIFEARLERVEPAATLVVVQVSGEHSIQRILELLYNTYTNRAQASAFVFRPDVRDAFSGDEIAIAMSGAYTGSSQFLNALSLAYQTPDSTFARFFEKPMFVLHADDFKPRLSENINPLLQTPPEVQVHLERAELLDDLRDAEMRFLMSESGAILPPVENTVYDNPSGSAARSFLRVGNIQYSRLAIDAVTFWLLLYVRDCEAILVDTWSLSSVAMNVSRVLATLRASKPVPVEMLSQYQDKSPERRAALTEILDRLVSEANTGSSGPLKVVCLVSVTHTGSLVGVLKEQIEVSRRMIALEFVALFRLGTAENLNTLCDLSMDAGFQKLAENEITGRASIPIDEKIYFPVRFVTVEHEVRIAQAEPFAPFLELVGGSDVITSHRNQIDDGKRRHHAIHLDTVKLAALAGFQDKFRDALKALDPPPSIILAPGHAAAAAMSSFACNTIAQIHGTHPEAITHANLDLKTTGLSATQDMAIRDKLVALPATSSILILDDCFVTGARLSGYQSRLRYHDIKARLHYMVGVARPDNPTTWADFQKKVGFRVVSDQQVYRRNTVRSLFDVIIPNWQEVKCPWCREKLLYERLESRGKVLPSSYRDRHLELADEDSGLRDNLFVGFGSSPLKLYSRSILAPETSNQAEVFTAVAAAIQQLRVVAQGEKPLLGPRRHPISTVLKADTYLLNIYTDSVIRASFLRGADWQELVYEDKVREAERSKYVEEIISSKSTDVRNLSVELLLAQGVDKCTVTEQAVRAAAHPDVSELFELVRSARR
ncbi:hypothetical protein [Rhizobium leguminosarum]|uniref:hypothetical protein n=1 Tax=Rhizobium leguminosarum TaxID=384 RepID=UPI00102FA3BD|nr:hypothetical protein [Rhizobium leguminosarum]TAY14018.1 hypothetical protein ELH96_20685 [Rhizobium leguminosarum]